MDTLLHKYGYMWVVTRMYLEFYKVPKYLDKVSVYTYPSKVRGGFSFTRIAGIDDENGNPLLKINSTWILMEHDTHKMVLRPSIPLFNETHDGELPDPGRVNKEEAKYLYSRTVRYCDCDLNDHLNNVRYVDMILDVFDNEFHKTKMISTMLLNYEREVKEGEIMDIYVSEDRSYIEGRVGEVTSFQAKLTFSKI